ncbi:MAG: polysaccharide biosynthesis protein [Brevundimonas sp.]|uniref:Lipopolysaccharide biosynthesis protein n=2 Tax=Brevundimonas albigilva TaxID=1312364 RepID=A0ABY4SRG8_9CAUL|nr:MULTISPECIES: lipopolysaccharide biosynthesis protein [Brevundimonas]PZU60399.1 MAG: polysaccharide biosynthesis protein [Brevundimonas sp.]UQV19752.1 lipopolysaccharide biosynthesis protein [Brevundimonas albigilva]URI16519.1 lipopolysaccharide biosynthesis protein [Brevundimonas albigilva]
MFWRGVWGYLPAQIVQGVVGFLTIVVFTRLLSPDDFGHYALAFSVTTLVHTATFTWLEASMARFWAAERTPEGLAAHFASLYRTSFALIAVFIPVAAVAVWLLPLTPGLKLAVAFGLAGAPVRNLAKLAQERYRAAGEVSRAAAVDMGVAILGFLVGAGFALAGAGAASPLVGLAIAPLFALPFILPGEVRQSKGGTVDRERLKAYAAYGYPIAASLTLAVVLASTDRFLLAAFMDAAAVGAYHASYSLANRTLDVMFIWLGAAGAPAMVMALERGGREALRQTALEQGSTLILIGLPAAVGLALVARPMAELMIGENLRAAAALVTPWIAASAFLSGMIAYYFGFGFTLGKKTALLLVTMAIPAVSNVVLNLILIPRLGVVGAAVSTAASFAIGLVACLVISRRAIALPIPWESLIRCGLAAGAMALVVVRLPPLGGFVELLVDAGVGALVYAAAALTLNAAGVRDVLKRLIASGRSVAA